MRRVRLLASGKVQGVFFRASAADRAAQLGLTGWVRNTADGQVQVEVQGAPEDVEAFVAYCRAGPGQARIAGVEVTDSDLLDGESGFQVRP